MLLLPDVLFHTGQVLGHHRPQSLSTLSLGTQNQVNLEAWTAQFDLVVLEEERGPESSCGLTKVTQTIRASPWLPRGKQLRGRASGKVGAGGSPQLQGTQGGCATRPTQCQAFRLG